jgi:hypothetical protein
MRAIRIVVLTLVAVVFLGISGSDASALDISEDFQPPPRHRRAWSLRLSAWRCLRGKSSSAECTR